MKALALIFTLTFLASCAPGGQSARSIAASAAQNVGCKYAQSEMWDSLQSAAENGAEFPDQATLRAELIKAAQTRGLSGAALDAYIDAYIANYQLVIEGIRSGFAPNSTDAWQKALAEVEVGIQTTAVHAKLQARLKTSLQNLDSAESQLGAACANARAEDSAPVTSEELSVPRLNYATVWDQLKATVAPEVYGARKVLAIAYQSCDVLKLDPIGANVPDVQGIKDLGDRGDGGHVREIASLASVDATDYYIHNQNLAASSCFEVRNDPLIYNFGGKPVTSTFHPSQLDLFTHSKSGGPTLGIDCSGYVFSALALAGLKLDSDPKKVLKANQVLAYGSLAFKEPQANGLRCLQKITVTATTSILPGDIVAINGHVIMIDSIGADPFGLSAIQSAAQCTSANIDPKKFDFVIAQSAPIRNGIGINRVEAANYMPESDTIRNGLVAYAVASCRAKFGLSPNINSPDLSIVRHLKTDACMTTKPLTMTHENCVSSCHPL